MGAPRRGRWQPASQACVSAYGGLQTPPLASRRTTAALLCEAHRGYAD